MNEEDLEFREKFRMSRLRTLIEYVPYYEKLIKTGTIKDIVITGQETLRQIYREDWKFTLSFQLLQPYGMDHITLLRTSLYKTLLWLAGKNYIDHFGISEISNTQRERRSDGIYAVYSGIATIDMRITGLSNIISENAKTFTNFFNHLLFSMANDDKIQTIVLGGTDDKLRQIAKFVLKERIAIINNTFDPNREVFKVPHLL